MTLLEFSQQFHDLDDSLQTAHSLCAVRFSISPSISDLDSLVGGVLLYLVLRDKISHIGGELG